MTVSAIIVAAGSGTRMGGAVAKQYLTVNGRPILAATLSVFDRCPAVDRIALVVPEADFDFCRKEVIAAAGGRKPTILVPGGPERQDSVCRGLQALDCAADDITVIHDGVRPFLTCERLTACIAEARIWGACILGLRVSDTLKSVDAEDRIQRTVERENLWQAQTPQAFRHALICRAHETARSEGRVATDDAQMVERLGISVKIIQGSPTNLKITGPADLMLADAISRM